MDESDDPELFDRAGPLTPIIFATLVASLIGLAAVAVVLLGLP